MANILRDRKGRKVFNLKFKCGSFEKYEYRIVYAENLERAKHRLITKYSMRDIKKDTIVNMEHTSRLVNIWRKKRPRVLKIQLVRSTNKQRNRGVVHEKKERMKELDVVRKFWNPGKK